MASLKTAVPAKDLKLVSIRSISGLTPDDVRELQALKIGSLQALIDAMTAHAGDLTKLSTVAVVIEKEQSDRIGDAALAHPDTPKAVKDAFVASAPATPASVDVTPAASTPASDGLIARAKKYWFTHIWH